MNITEDNTRRQMFRSMHMYDHGMRARTIPAPCRSFHRSVSSSVKSCGGEHSTDPIYSQSYNESLTSVIDTDWLQFHLHNGSQDDYQPIPTSWSVKNVETMPRFMHVERSSVEITVPPNIVHDRLVEFLRVNSIAARWDSATARVVCVTQNLTKFILQLWKLDDKIVLEAQRRRGCCIQFHHVCHALFQTIETGLVERPRSGAPAPPLDCSISRKYKKISSCMRHVYEESQGKDEDLPKDCAVTNTTLNMLLHKCMDVNRLGLEKLCIATNPDPSSNEEHDVGNLKAISGQILFGTGKCGHKMREWLLRTINATWLEGCSNIVDDDKDEEDCETIHRAAMHTLALRLLVNTLKIQTASSSLSSMDLTYWRKQLVVGLTHNLATAGRNPHAASLSATCLWYLLGCSPEFDKRSIASRVVSALINAHQYGVERHLSLETEAQNLLDLIACALD